MSLLECFIYPGRSTSISIHMEWFIWVIQWRFQGKGPKGPGPHLIFRPYWGPKGRRRFFWRRRWSLHGEQLFLPLQVCIYKIYWRKMTIDEKMKTSMQLKARWIIPLSRGALMKKGAGMAVGILFQTPLKLKETNQGVVQALLRFICWAWK